FVRVNLEFDLAQKSKTETACRRSTTCPLWVKSRHAALNWRSPLYTRKRTLLRTRRKSACLSGDFLNLARSCCSTKTCAGVDLSLNFGLAAKAPKRDGCHTCHYPNLGNTNYVSVRGNANKPS